MFTKHLINRGPAWALLAVSAALVLASGCGPSHQALCDAWRSASCPSGQVNDAVALGMESDCLNNLVAVCNDKYRTLIECETATPICDVQNPDGSYTAVGAISCGTERDAFLGCALAGG